MKSFTIDAVRLLVHEVPNGQDLNEEQRLGKRCVWCGCSAPVIDLGGISARFRPQACAPCHILHSALLTSYFDWATHVDDCILCVQQRPCPTTDRLRRMHAAARRAVHGLDEDKRLVCFECRKSVNLDHPALPVLWLGEAAGAHLLFSHAGRCPGEVADIHG